MATMSNEVMGVVRADGSLELAGKLTLPAGRVRVRVETVEEPPRPAESLIEYVARSRREREAAGHAFRTREEIDAEIAAMRDEWDGEG